MTNQIQKISHKQFGEIRMTVRDDSAWFCLADVCNSLSIKNPRDLNKRLRKGGVDTIDTPTYNQFGTLVMQPMTYVNEGNLYRCIFQSRKAEAEQFQDWVFEDVLPQIRATGGYIPTRNKQGELLSADEVLDEAKKIVTNTIDQQNKKIEAMKHQLDEQQPKVLFADAVSESVTSIYIGDLAKLLARNGIEIGRNRLFGWLRRHGYLFQNKVEPIQKWVEKGIFSVHITLYEDPRGNLFEHLLTKVTPKGQLYFVNLFLKNKDLVNQ